MASESIIPLYSLLLIIFISGFLYNIECSTESQVELKDQNVKLNEAKWFQQTESSKENDFHLISKLIQENNKITPNQKDKMNASSDIPSIFLPLTAIRLEIKTKESKQEKSSKGKLSVEEIHFGDGKSIIRSDDSPVFFTHRQKYHQLRFPDDRNPNPNNRLQLPDEELATTTDLPIKTLEKVESSQENDESFFSTTSNDTKKTTNLNDSPENAIRIRTMDLTLNIVRNSNWGEQNIVFSPLSIYNVLALLMLGSEGITYNEISEVLSVKNVPQISHEENSKRFHEAFHNLLLLLHKKSGKNVSIEIANEIFADKKFELENGYVTNAKEFYQTPVESFNFGTDGKLFRDQVNYWVQQKTNGKIKSIVDEPPSTDTTMAFINAVYFKGNWEIPFFEKITRKKQFFVKENETIEVQMMTNVMTIPYLEHEDYQLVGIPYKGNRTGFFVILPKSSNGIIGLQKIEKNLSAKDITEKIWNMKPQKVALKIPKMKISTDGHMKDILTSLGMSSAFDSLRSNFSKISSRDGLFLSAIHHRAMMEVNEKGTEAAAVTLGTGDRTIDELPIPFVANKPFLFFIYHISADTVLFWGRVTRPQWA